MDIRYGPELLEEVVTRELLRREAGGNRDAAVFRREADLLYLVPGQGARDSAFERLHASWFRKLGFAAPAERAVADFPSFRGVVEEIRIDRARGAGDEEADLMVDSVSGRKAVRVRVRTERFTELSPDQGHHQGAGAGGESGAGTRTGTSQGLGRGQDRLEGFLRQELWHVADMLRPEFGYQAPGRLAERPVEENLVRARLRLLWNLAVAGVLERRGRPGAASRGEWARLAARLYPALNPEARAKLVAALWSADGIAYPDLVRRAVRPEELLAFAGISGAVASSAGPGAGMSCPLCGFSTFDWTADWSLVPAPAVGAIAADFPGWTRERGACRQCSDVYAIRAAMGEGLPALSEVEGPAPTSPAGRGRKPAPTA